MGSDPIYVISGKERRQLKKRLGELKRFIKMYWYWEDIDEVYVGGVSKIESTMILEKKQTEINELQDRLSKRL